MATYIFHRLIMGKVEIDNCFCLNGDNYLEFIFTETFHMDFVQIAEFDWLPGQKG